MSTPMPARGAADITKPKAHAVTAGNAADQTVAADRAAMSPTPRRLQLPHGLRWLGWAPITVLAGLAQALSLAAPWNGQPLWWLQILSMAVLAWQISGPTSAPAPRVGAPLPIGLTWRGRALRGWIFATAWLTGTFWWLFISMHTYGDLSAPLAALAVVGLAAVLSLYFTLICAFFRGFRYANTPHAAINFAALWLLAELMRAQWFTGFPWGASGYAHIDGPLAGYAPLVGVYGIGALAAGLAMVLAQCGRWVQAVRFAKKAVFSAAGLPGLPGLPGRPAGCASVAVSAVLAVAVLAGGAVLQRLDLFAGSSAGVLRVALLQGNIAQDEKFQPGSGVATALSWYGEQLASVQAPLVVAPETAIPLLPQQLPLGFVEKLRQDFGAIPAGAPDGRVERAALVGMPLGNFTSGYTNAVVGFKPGQTASNAYRYEKHHLVPFGEFVPPLFRWFTDLLQIPLGDFNRGTVPQPAFDWQGQRLAPNICYEDLFGEEIAAQFQNAATSPTMLVNLSNIAWFGDSIAIDQHLQISRMRTLELARPMLRATNTGATAIIDHTGHVTDELPRLVRGVLVGDAEGRNGITPYAWWAMRFGLFPLWCLGILVVGSDFWARRRMSKSL